MRSILITMTLISFGVAQPSFTVNSITTSANGARDIYTIDIDGDGDVDIVTGSSIDKTVAWYENNGSQSFTKITISTDADAVISVFAIDLDLDGDMDVLSASQQDDKVAWYENDGASDPSFTTHNIIIDADGASYLYAVDLDGDGDIDIVSNAMSENKIYWFENDGASDPSFSTNTLASTTAPPNGIHAVDVDGDGDIDVLNTMPGADKIIWYENNGAADPSFTANTVTSSAADSPNQVYAVDLDNDGDIDIISSSYNDDKIIWFESDGAADPSFTANTITSSADGAITVYAVDVDGDGDIDVISGSENDDKVAWYENDGAADPSFTTHSITTSADAIASVFAADVDRDGDMDILSASYIDDKIAWYENNSITPSLPTITTEYAVDGSFDVRSVYATDMDGDGDVDIVGAANDGDDISWWENDGTPNNADWTEYIVDGDFDGAWSVYATDMDGDGDVDIVGAAYGSDDISWWENDGTPNNANWTEYLVDGDFDGAVSIYATDMDGDGDVDIVGAAWVGDDISWWENDGTPNNASWTEYLIDGSFNGANSVYATDMDGDGDVDVLGAAYGSDDISWWENDGTPNNADWTEYIVDGDFDIAYSVYATDMDGDGDVDILGAARNGNDISWWENDGTPNNADWTEYLVDGDFDGAVSIYATDMDGDGDVDILGAAYDDNDISWWENDGTPNNANWTEHAVDGSFGGAFSVYATDMDGDGDVDVLGGSRSGDAIAWYESKTTVVSGNAGFRMLSSPVAGTINDELLAPFWTQGMTGADYTGGDANVWTYNAASSAWAALTNLTTDSYTAGAGILIYVYTDVDYDGDDDIAGGVNVGIVNGTENSATVSISTTASAWNLLGNPFVATIDADQLFSDNSNYTAVVYVYDDANSQYNTWNGSTGDLSNGLISPYQGFWIQSGGSGTTFQFTSSCKSTSVGTFYRTMSDSSGSVAFQLSSGSYNSTAFLSFNIDALAGIDNADAYKLLPFGADDHLTSMFYVGEVALNTSNLPFNITNPMTADMDVMLLTAANDSFYTNTGNVSMSWDIGSMPEDMTIHLLDQITLDTVDIRAVGSYTFALVEKGGFSATGGTSPALYPRQGQNRFKVLVNTTTVSVDEELLPIQYALHQNYPNPFNPITTLRYDIPENSYVTIIIYDMLGRQVKTLINQTQDAGYKSIIWDATNDYGKPVSAGIYLYQIHAGEYMQTKKMVLLK